MLHRYQFNWPFLGWLFYWLNGYQIFFSKASCGNLKNLSQVISTTGRAKESDNLIVDTSQEQSYDISPYKGSDDEDEDEEDDDHEPSKFIPSWARYVTQFCHPKNKLGDSIVSFHQKKEHV